MGKGDLCRYVNTETLGRLAYLDVLKAVAIIAVVLYHSGFLSYGYLGVDIFLVIAGFLITKSLEKKQGAYFAFIVSRVIRLLPVLLAAGLVAMVLGWFTMLPDDYENLSQSVIATNLFGNNVLSAITTGNYWDIANDYKPLMHTWYVGLLMQFYLVYPLLFYTAKLDRKTPRKTLFVLVSSLAVLSLVCFFACPNDVNRFYYLPSRFFEFAVGGIIALVYNPSHGRVFHPAISYLCYALLLALLTVNIQIIPDSVRLVLVVALTLALILSADALGNRITSNSVLAKIGAASYSIFVWHQVLLAFYRYIIGPHFSVWTYLLYVAAVALVSWVSYRLIEQGVSRAMATNNGKRTVYVATLAGWLVLTGFACLIYMNAGVVRDVPELNVSLQNKHRHMHAEYCDSAFQYDRPFVSTGKPHWLVIGNSFGRDFVNTIMESEIADQVEVSYTNDYSNPDNAQRFSSADRVFISKRGVDEEFVSAVEELCSENGLSPERIVIVGEKSFGENNGHIYAKRNRDDYFDQYVEVEGGAQFLERNRGFSELYGERFLDLMSMVLNDDGRVRVFTPDHHFISADCDHLSVDGARYFAGMIDWDKYLTVNN